MGGDPLDPLDSLYEGCAYVGCACTCGVDVNASVAIGAGVTVTVCAGELGVTVCSTGADVDAGAGVVGADGVGVDVGDGVGEGVGDADADARRLSFAVTFNVDALVGVCGNKVLVAGGGDCLGAIGCSTRSRVVSGLREIAWSMRHRTTRQRRPLR